MFIKSEESENNGVLQAANLILLAIRTSPKSRGMDNIVTAVLTGREKDEFAMKMKSTGEENNNGTFLRDAQNVKDCAALILAGTKLKSAGLKLCGFCGFADCAELERNNGICVYNPTDLGIALGSAVSTAALLKTDNRIMYTAGYTALKTKILGDDVKIAFGLPLSVTGKNIFFDRNTRDVVK
jgi:uncharacterized ferredoxin-like protein